MEPSDLAQSLVLLEKMQGVMPFHPIYEMIRREEIILHLGCTNLTFMKTIDDIAFSWKLHSDYKLAPFSASLSLNISYGMLRGKEITRYEVIL